jgi:hypothetical protein
MQLTSAQHPHIYLIGRHCQFHLDLSTPRWFAGLHYMGKATQVVHQLSKKDAGQQNDNTL